jgi:hypothetical protein
MRTPILVLVVLALGALFLPGCITADTTSKVSEDGAISRTVRMISSDPTAGDDLTKAIGELKARIAFAGEGWTTKEGKDDTSVFFEGSRQVPVGQYNDYTIKSAEGIDLVTVAVSTERMQDGTVVYTETFRWVRQKDKDDYAKSVQEFTSNLRKEFPDVFNEAEAKEFGEKATSSISAALLGPNQPLLFRLLFAGRSGERELRIAVYRRMELVLSQVKPGLDPAAQRKILVALSQRETIEGLSPEGVPDPSNPGEEPSANVPTLIYSVVEGPGQVIETNGIVDPIDGSVAFEMLDSGAVPGDQVFRIIFKP